MTGVKLRPIEVAELPVFLTSVIAKISGGREKTTKKLKRKNKKAAIIFLGSRKMIEHNAVFGKGRISGGVYIVHSGGEQKWKGFSNDSGEVNARLGFFGGRGGLGDPKKVLG